MSPMVNEQRRQGGFNLDDYVTVAERIGLFYDKFPDGSLQAELVELAPDHVVVRGLAYRSATDERPGVAHSALTIPGTTPYTRGSEIENAETSAIGRAIAMLGFGVKKSVATRDEIRTKEGAAENGHRPDRAPTSDGGLIGIAEIGKTGTADFELRQTPDGHVLSFRLVDGRKGIKVTAQDPIASALAVVKDDVLGKRVTVWGRVSDESFAKDGKTINYQVLHLERIQTPDLTLPAPDGLSPADEAELDAIAI